MLVCVYDAVVIDNYNDVCANGARIDAHTPFVMRMMYILTRICI
jgi:hypothetical protein